MTPNYEMSETSKIVFVSYRPKHTQLPDVNYVWFYYKQLAPLKTREDLQAAFKTEWPMSRGSIILPENGGLLDLILDCFQIARDELIDKGLIQEEE